MRIAALLLLLATTALADPKPAQDSVDWLLSHASTQPTTKPASTQPTSPFAARKPNPDARPGTLTLSNGKQIKATLSTTPEKPLRIFDEAAQDYKDIPFTLVQSIQAKVLWERDEKEWHFKDSGSDIKEYSGKTYPARELQYTLTLVNDQKITGGLVAPIYAASGDQTLTYILNKRQKGQVGKTLKDLLYIKSIELK